MDLSYLPNMLPEIVWDPASGQWVRKGTIPDYKRFEMGTFDPTEHTILNTQPIDASQLDYGNDFQYVSPYDTVDYQEKKAEREKGVQEIGSIENQQANVKDPETPSQFARPGAEMLAGLFALMLQGQGGGQGDQFMGGWRQGIASDRQRQYQDRLNASERERERLKVLAKQAERKVGLVESDMSDIVKKVDDENTARMRKYTLDLQAKIAEGKLDAKEREKAISQYYKDLDTTIKERGANPGQQVVDSFESRRKLLDPSGEIIQPFVWGGQTFRDKKEGRDQAKFDEWVANAPQRKLEKEKKLRDMDARYADLQVSTRNKLLREQKEKLILEYLPAELDLNLDIMRQTLNDKRLTHSMNIIRRDLLRDAPATAMAMEQYNYASSLVKSANSALDSAKAELANAELEWQNFESVTEGLDDDDNYPLDKDVKVGVVRKLLKSAKSARLADMTSAASTINKLTGDLEAYRAKAFPGADGSLPFNPNRATYQWTPTGPVRTISGPVKRSIFGR